MRGLLGKGPDLGTGEMAESIVYLEERRERRVFVKCPLEYEIGGINLKGFTVNVSRRGVMVQSPLSLETAFEVFRTLDGKPDYHAVLELTLEERTYVIDAGIKHFHLDGSGNGAYVLRVGFGFQGKSLEIRPKG